MKNKNWKNPLKTVNEMKANCIMYMVQDMLDNVSRNPIDLKWFEKEVLKLINNKKLTI